MPTQNLTAPIVNDDSYSISIFDLPLIVNPNAGLLSNDTTPDGSPLTAVLAESAENGTVTLNEDGSFSYQPNPGFIGIDSFTYTAFSEEGLSNTASVLINVSPLPIPPDDAIIGSNAAEQLRGSATEDYLIGLGGNDTLIGRAGDDIIDAGNGQDLVFGRAGAELIDGGRGNDTLDGGRGSDVLFGGEGNDFLKGQRDNDFLLGGQGNDEIRGHSGNDILVGDEGNDTLRGGSDNDIFVLTLESGTDLIADFVLAEDTIALAEGLSFGVLSFETSEGSTIISVNGDLLAEVRVEGNGSLNNESNFVIF